MTYATTETETYTVADIETVMRRVTADLVMIANSTGGVTEEKARDWAHDVELLAKKGYLSAVDVTLFSAGVEQKAVRFDVDAETGDLVMSRPGGILWPRVASPSLRIILFYTHAYDANAKANIKGLRISWVASNDDTSHSGLSSSGGRAYVSNGYGLQRKDYTK